MLANVLRKSCDRASASPAASKIAAIVFLKSALRLPVRFGNIKSWSGATFSPRSIRSDRISSSAGSPIGLVDRPVFDSLSRTHDPARQSHSTGGQKFPRGASRSTRSTDRGHSLGLCGRVISQRSPQRCRRPFLLTSAWRANQPLCHETAPWLPRRARRRAPNLTANWATGVPLALRRACQGAQSSGL
jgi:hypothetical protein